jgi:hypothetical protein
MTGRSVANGEMVEVNPTEAAPAQVLWRHH